MRPLQTALSHQISANIRKNLISYMQLHEMKQKDFSVFTEVGESTLSCYLSKKRIPSAEVLVRLAHKIDMTVSELIGEQDVFEDKSTTEPSSVVRVVDGDTIIVRYEGEDVRVRLIGIDTPESVHPDKSKNIPEGTTASDYTKSLVEGKRVYLEFGKQKYDRYNRMLAYVYLENGTFLNAHLLEVGMANVATFPPNIEHLALFESIEKERELHGV